jgi:hypothetical protein
MFITSASLPILILSGLLLFVLAWLIRTESRLRKFMRGSNGESLEQDLGLILEKVEYMASQYDAITSHHTELTRIFETCIRGVATVRFDPYQGSTGNQSYATAVINSYGDGVVFSSLYSREHTRVFAKPLVGLTSEYRLSKEEHEAIDLAKKSM